MDGKRREGGGRWEGGRWEGGRGVGGREGGGREGGGREGWKWEGGGREGGRWMEVGGREMEGGREEGGRWEGGGREVGERWEGGRDGGAEKLMICMHFTLLVYLYEGRDHGGWISISDFNPSRISAVVSMHKILAVELTHGDIRGRPDI